MLIIQTILVCNLSTVILTVNYFAFHYKQYCISISVYFCTVYVLRILYCTLSLQYDVLYIVLSTSTCILYCVQQGGPTLLGQGANNLAPRWSKEPKASNMVKTKNLCILNYSDVTKKGFLFPAGSRKWNFILSGSGRSRSRNQMQYINGELCNW